MSIHLLKTNIRKALCLLLAALLLMQIVPALADGQPMTYGQVSCNQLNLRDRPDEKGALLGSYECGCFVAVSECQNDWCRVHMPDGAEGYMMAKYLRREPEMTGLTAKVATGGPELNLRESPNSLSTVLTRMPEGAQVTLTRAEGRYYRVLYEGRPGFAEGNYLQFQGKPDVLETGHSGLKELRTLDPDKPMIALTFDDGPSESTQRILSAIDSVGGRATFCVVGNRVRGRESILRAIAQQGSEIATHSFSHADLTVLDEQGARDELEKSISAIQDACGLKPTVLRAPYGKSNEALTELCGKLGLVIAQWNIDPQDWKTRNAQSTYEGILANARDGGIVVCHDLYSETADAIEKLVTELTKQGYQLVTVTEMLEARAGGGTPGEIYASVVKA